MGAFGSIDLSRFNDSTAVDLKGQVHQLPCCIKYDGPSSVSHYFKPKSTGIEVDGLKMEEAYFRGRKLQGTTVHLPQGYSGFVIGKKGLGKRKASDQSEEISNSWEMKAKFQSITFWNHDSLPSQDDAFVRSFHWLTVTKAVSFCLICVLKKKRIKFDQSLVALSLVTWLKMLKFLPSQCHCLWESLRSKCPIHGFEFQRKQQMAYITNYRNKDHVKVSRACYC
ncbi:hypothetical protein RHGRI_036965 [Rhododendron griersonianum]|uniref:Uncharacterized protein n=1 Tax=Rhododendron griersonianum TaxID=479676 RepID=A0AAV6HVR9_9ERIC|nr:hypothetical protein RHGRI_036965 [Rhododendron griersonianum]